MLNITYVDYVLNFLHLDAKPHSFKRVKVRTNECSWVLQLFNSNCGKCLRSSKNGLFHSYFYKYIFPSVGYSCGEGNGTPLQYSCLENPMGGGAWWAAIRGVAKSQTRLSDFTFTFHFHALEKEMATHSSVLAWRIPGTGESGGLLSMGSHRVGHDWSDLAAAGYACGIESPAILTYFSPFLWVFFLPALSRYNLHTALYKFKVYSIMTWVMYIMKWLAQ